jgi:hypothetical protein
MYLVSDALPTFWASGLGSVYHLLHTLGSDRTGTDEVSVLRIYKTGGFFGFFYLRYVLYSTLLHLPPLRFQCVGGCWNQNQDCSDFGISSLTLSPLIRIYVH